MALLLCIEAGTDIGSVALAKNDRLLSLRESCESRQHAQNLAVYVEEILRENDLDAKDLDAVAVGMGPGSYTGLRICVSLAKGICYGAGIPLIAVGSLEALTRVALEDYEAGILNVDDISDAILLPMIDARRMEVFTAVYDLALNEVMPNQAMILDENSFADLLESHKLHFMGNGADKASDLIKSQNAEFTLGIRPNAADMIALSEKAFRENDFLDLAYSTPNYIKKFHTTTPKKNVLGCQPTK